MNLCTTIYYYDTSSAPVLLYYYYIIERAGTVYYDAVSICIVLRAENAETKRDFYYHRTRIAVIIIITIVVVLRPMCIAGITLNNAPLYPEPCSHRRRAYPA